VSVVDDTDFLTNRAKQLAAVNELAHLPTRLVDLQAELLNRQQERRQVVQRVAEQDLARQAASGRSSRTASIEVAIAAAADRSIGLVGQRGAA